jgi:3-dehydrosphinganine reductase
VTEKFGKYDGRLVLITGGSSGMGLALARLLAAEGARIWLMARRADALEAALASLPSPMGQQHGSVGADLTQWDQVEAATGQVRKQVGLPDVLINAAGSAHPAYLQDTSLQIFHEMMDLNYFGTVHTIKALAPSMIERGSGYIVNFSSGAGFLAPFGYAAYVPSKYAVRGLSDALRLELKPLGVRVSVVFPPDTDTPGFKNENRTKPWETVEAFSSTVLSADKVARGILRGMKRGQYIILPGFEISLYYRLTFWLGSAVYPLMDMLLAQARRKKQRVERG